ncbi:hypothetical protein CQW23_28614 [Capsicum baccatum]|uniref:O-methyltransferase C-terminal domain-containing protein n=1 Tax=Capsicum baccatum TaxID=33114 RepID=A0A2G2VH39_CAPBA|nr:hypothetical protein CQW23_28614 [Capsicum baccatum]
MPQTKNLSFVEGDIFQSIPHADAIFLKLVMHNWSYEDCVKILQRSREANTYNNEGRKEKVLILDMVLNRYEDKEDMIEVKLLFDVLIMVLLAGEGGRGRELRKNEKGYSLSLDS